MTDIEMLEREDGILISPGYTSSIRLVKEGDCVLPFQRFSMVDTDKFLADVSEGVVGFKCPDILPRNCRFYASDPADNMLMFVIENPPTVRTVKLNMDVSYFLERIKQEGKLEAYGYKDLKLGRPPHQFRLSFPYMVFIVCIDENLRYRGCKVFFRTSPLVSLQDFLLRCNLFNVDGGGNMCIAGHENPEVVKSLGNLATGVTSLNERVNQVLDRIWSNAFNTEYHGAQESYKNIPQLSNPFEWQYFSKSDPMFVLKAPWIQNSRNLLQEIENLQLRRSSDTVPVIDRLRSIVYGRSGGTQKPIERGVTESVYLQSEQIPDDDEDDDVQLSSSATSYTISVGDQIELNKKMFYVTAFKYDKVGLSIVELEDEEGNKTDHKLDQRFKNRVIKSLMKKEPTQVTTKSGKTIKRGDIIALRIPGYNKLMTVDSVRVSRDGFTEIRSGNNVFLVDFVNFDIIDPNNIVIEGISFRKGEPFLVKTSVDKIPNKVIQGYISNFDSLQYNKLLFKVDGSDRILKVDVLGNVTNNVTKLESELTHLPVVRIGNRISISTPMSKIFMTTDRKIILQGEPLHLTDNVREWIKVTRETILLENDTRVFIPSYDVDIDLKVGDFVVISNWAAPSECLRIRKIVRFDLSGRKLNVVTTVDGEPEVTVPFCDFITGSVSVGLIRKAAFAIDGLTIGVEVIPKQRVTGFLKSKPCRISAFIIDEKVPLVFCNNFHTFWLTEENKKLFTFNSFPSEVSAVHELKLSVQIGDLFCQESYDTNLFEPFTFTYYDGRKTVRKVYGCSSFRWIRPIVSQQRFQYFLQYGFPSQRKKQIKEDAIPNFFSWYVNDDGISRNIM